MSTEPKLSSNTAADDPIVAQVRADRDAIAATVRYDLDALFDRVKALEDTERAKGRVILPSSSSTSGAAA